MIPPRLFLRATRATNRGRFMAGAILLDEKQPFETLAKHDKIVIHSLVMYGNTIVPRGDFPDDMIDNFQVEKIKAASLAAIFYSSGYFRDIILWDLFAVKSLLKVAIFRQPSKVLSPFFPISLSPITNSAICYMFFLFLVVETILEISYKNIKKHYYLVRNMLSISRD